jgi:glycosyltransferase involved in cell wall biosynthesis
MTKFFWEYEETPNYFVSILIASYNTKKIFISECLKSITNQDGFFGIELIWINDGSDRKHGEDLEACLAEFTKGKKNTKMKYYKFQQNHGLSYCLNYGVKHASNELIFRMDSDDMMTDYRMLTQLSYMLDHPDCVICGTDIVKIEGVGDEKTILYSNKDRPHPETITWDEYKKTKQTWIMNHPTVCFKRSAVLSVGNYDRTLRMPFEDLDLELRLLKKYNVIHNIKKPLLFYRIHSEQVTREFSGDKDVVVLLDEEGERRKAEMEKARAEMIDLLID